MPRVGVYGPRRIGATPVAGVRREAAETLASSGGLQAAAQQQRGEAVEQIATRGAAALTQWYEQDRDAADELAVLGAKRRLGEVELELLHNADTGALNVKGIKALDQRRAVLETFDERTNAIGDELTERQYAAYASAQQARRLAIAGTLEEHGAREFARYDEQETAAVVNQQLALAVASAGNRDAVTQALVDGEQTIRAHAARQGLGAAAAADVIAKYRNELAVGVITQAIATGHDQDARAYFEVAQQSGVLTGPALTRITEVVQRATTDAEAERHAGEIWEQFAAAAADDDAAVIELDKMERAARAAISDTQVLDATIARLRSRKGGVEDARRERMDALNNTVWGAIVKGSTEDQVTRLPAFVRSDGKFQASVRAYYREEADREQAKRDRAESRAYTAASREYTETLHAAATAAREEQERENNGWGEYFELSQPARLRAMSEGDILAKLPTLGRDHVNRLITARRELVRDAATFRAATIDNDLFQQIAFDNGLDYVYTPSKKQREPLGKLKTAVEDAIGQAQVKAGRRLTRDETRAEMTAVIHDKVFVDRAFWGDPELPAAMVNPADVATAYLPIASVPDAYQADYVNLITANVQGASRLSKKEVLAKYGDRIGKAYARKLLNQPAEKILEALRGK